MSLVNVCFNKVKKNCFKFIRSQETSKEKFSNKDKMLKAFLIPMCFWIAKKANNKKPYFVGLAGGQGTGKTTISSIIKIILEKNFKLKVFRLLTGITGTALNKDNIRQFLRKGAHCGVHAL